MSLPVPLPARIEAAPPPSAHAARARSRLGGLAFPGALLLVPAWLFRAALFRGQVFYYRDIHMQWVGQAEAFVRAVAAGSWPVWNPYVSFGQPLLANANAQVLYPLTWLNLQMPPWTYYTLFVFAHFVLAGAGMFLLCRRLGLGPLASAVGGALWIASGPFVSLVSLWNHLAGAAWIPWAAWAADRALATGTARAAVVWGAILAAPVLAGSPETTLMAGLVGLVVGARHVRHWKRAPALTLVALAAAAGLSAAQWIPSTELARRSVRAQLDEEERALWSTRPVGLLLTVVPALLDPMPLRTEVRAALFDAREAYLPSIYLGLPAAAMVLAGLASRRRLAWVLAALAALAALLALGRFGPVYPLLLRLVPPLGVLRFPVKALVIVAFAWALLAGIGFEAWTARARRGAARRVGDVGLAVGGLAALASALWTARHAEAMGGMLLDARLSRHPASAVLAPAVAALWAAGMTMALLLASSLGRGRIGRHWALAAAVVLAAELVAVHRDLSPTVAPTFYRDRPPALAALQGPPLGRVYSFDYTEPGKALHYLGHGAYLIKAGTADPPAWLDAAASRAGLFPSALGSWGVETAYGVDALGLYPPPLANLNWTLRKYEETPLHTRLLRLAAVTRVVALHTRGLEDLVPLAVLPTLYVEPLRVLGVPDPLPRAFVVDGVRVAAGEWDALHALTDAAFDPRREVVLAEGEPAAPEPSFTGASTVTSWKPDRVAIDAELSRRGHLVLEDVYDPGWKATVDGRTAPVLPANAAFCAVALAPGRHHVTFTYRPRSVVLGLLVSVATLVVLVSATTASRWRGRGRVAGA